MKNDDGFIEFLHELLEPEGTIATRRMFGGHGVYCDGVFMAIVIDGRLYLKADAESEPPGSRWPPRGARANARAGFRARSKRSDLADYQRAH